MPNRRRKANHLPKPAAIPYLDAGAALYDWKRAFQDAFETQDAAPLRALVRMCCRRIGELDEPLHLTGLAEVLDLWCHLTCMPQQLGGKSALLLLLHAEGATLLKLVLPRISDKWLPFYGAFFIQQAIRHVPPPSGPRVPRDLPHVNMAVWEHLPALVPQLVQIAMHGQVVMERLIAVSALGQLSTFHNIIPPQFSKKELAEALAATGKLLHFDAEWFKNEMKSEHADYLARILSRGIWNPDECMKRAGHVVTAVHREAMSALLMLMTAYVAWGWDDALLQELQRNGIVQSLLCIIEHCRDPQALLVAGEIFHNLCHGHFPALLGACREPEFLSVLFALFENFQCAELFRADSILKHLTGRVLNRGLGKSFVGQWFDRQVGDCLVHGKFQHFLNVLRAPYERGSKSAFDADADSKFSLYAKVWSLAFRWQPETSAGTKPLLRKRVPRFDTSSLLHNWIRSTLSLTRESPKVVCACIMDLLNPVVLGLDRLGAPAAKLPHVVSTSFTSLNYDTELGPESQGFDAEELQRRVDTILQQCQVARENRIMHVHEHQAFIMRVEICGIIPTIWRRIQCPCQASLAVLHDRLLAPSIGWCRNYHGYLFFGGDERSIGFCPPASGASEMIDRDTRETKYQDVAIVSAEQVALCDLVAKPGDKMKYVYDLRMGTCWEHLLTVEDVVSLPDDTRKFVCVDGERACPPESLGSARYVECLQILTAGPSVNGEFWFWSWLSCCTMNICGKALAPEYFSVEDAQAHVDAAVGSSLKADGRYTTHPQLSPHVLSESQDMTVALHQPFSREEEQAFVERRAFEVIRFQQCSFCMASGDMNATRKMLLCGRCKGVRYCSRARQKNDWKKHKDMCFAAR